MFLRDNQETDLTLDASVSSEKGEMLNIIENIEGAHDYILDMAKPTLQTVLTSSFLYRSSSDMTQRVQDIGCRTVAACQRAG